jgi:F-type H+-transporting ATPase subunit a
MYLAAETIDELDVFHLFLFDPFWFEGTPFAVNRVVVLMWAASALCLSVFLIGSRRRALVPRGLQNIVEVGYLFVRNNIVIDIIGPNGVRYVPYLASLFFFIFFSNVFGILPGINFPTTSRMAIPAFLALLTWIIFVFVGIKNHGLRYFKDTLFPPGIPWPVYIILAPIELLSVFIIRPFTLAIRLLANMFAGHVLLAVFFIFTNQLLQPTLTAPLGVLTLATASALIVFELLIATIQAYIFTTLTAFYIAESEAGHGHEEEALEAHEAPDVMETDQRTTELQTA